MEAALEATGPLKLCQAEREITEEQGAARKLKGIGWSGSELYATRRCMPSAACLGREELDSRQQCAEGSGCRHAQEHEKKHRLAPPYHLTPRWRKVSMSITPMFPLYSPRKPRRTERPSLLQGCCDSVTGDVT